MTQRPDPAADERIDMQMPPCLFCKYRDESDGELSSDKWCERPELQSEADIYNEEYADLLDAEEKCAADDYKYFEMVKGIDYEPRTQRRAASSE